MKEFLERHRQSIRGVLSCFDRVVFKGYLPLPRGESMEAFLAGRGLRIKDFGSFAEKQSKRLKAYGQAMAERAGRPYEYWSGANEKKKEARARELAERDGVTQGLVCVLGATESGPSFKMIGGQGKPRLVRATRPGLCLYFYFLEGDLGWLHVRLQTWFPFAIQVAVNGHEVLARQMDRAGLAYEQCDNVFTSLADARKAQQLADRFARRDWSHRLTALARRVNPLLRDLLKKMTYAWFTDQAEYATDVLFESRAALRPLYEDLRRHATLCFSPENVLTFLGQKLTGRFTGEVKTSVRRREPGTCVRHRVGSNWIKMYDKIGRVLRVETVINRPYVFKVRRWGTKGGQQGMDWFPLAKAVEHLPRYLEVCLAANRRYLTALACVRDPRTAQRELLVFSRRIRRKDRPYRGFNPADPQDVALCRAVLAGAHCVRAFSNADVRTRLWAKPRSAADRRRQSAAVTRLLKRLHVRELIAKVPRTRRWQVTKRGYAVMTMVIKLHGDLYPEELLREAA